MVQDAENSLHGTEEEYLHRLFSEVPVKEPSSQNHCTCSGYAIHALKQLDPRQKQQNFKLFFLPPPYLLYVLWAQGQGV